MTIGNYIQAKLNRFHLSIENEELDVILSSDNVTSNTDYTPAHNEVIKRALIAVIPELLIAPDWTQGGTSIKRNIEGVKLYYSILCKELGVPDLLNPEVSYDVRDISDRW
ncbi:DUF6706 family protein [Pedobacter panaciterrae]